jgi:glycosyltransferase involved in cell wall biosynthesis
VTPRFSVVVPTYQRRDVVLASIRAFEDQDFFGSFEVVVVVDGSTDGTEEALRALSTPFPLSVVQQENRGLAAARNRGAEEAHGELLLFLDDDMEPHPRLLREHDLSHREGADVVVGHIPLHPDSPANFLSEAVGAWAELRARELSAANGQLQLQELLGGQMSLRRGLFWELGGFDTDFTRGGSFGNEDLELGHRLTQTGRRVVFNRDAISWQRYVVTPRHYLRQWRQAGRADVLLARKHPDQLNVIFHRRERAIDRSLYRWLRLPIRGVMLQLVRISSRPIVRRWFFRVRNLEYFQGVRDAGGVPVQTSVRVLCYHAIADLAGARVMEPYGVPPAAFRKQVKLLGRYFRFVSPHELLRLLSGEGGVPKRAIILTFDDCYEDLLESALPTLREHGVPALAFAVTALLGRTNEWDQRLGATQLRLLDEAGLRALSDGGVLVASHTRTHPVLNQVSESALEEELDGSLSDVQALGVRSLPVLAYPHGEFNELVKARVRAAGFRAAFTVASGIADARNIDPFAVPRIEILRRDSGLRFLWKVIAAGRPRAFPGGG